MFLLLQGLALAAGDFKFITTEELKKKMDAGESLLLVDALSPIEFNEMSIKGSVNIPSSRVKAGHPLLPADKGSLIVFYCKGPKCNKSRIAAENAQKLGYTNILVYNDGIPAWAKAGLPLDHAVEYPKLKTVRLAPKELHAQLGSVEVLDIRGKQHLELGKIKGAINISFDDLDTEFAKLPKGKKIVIVDHAGKQVNIAAKFLHMKGYTDPAVLDGGILVWLRDGLPVEK
ncbi:MAG: rhodanese-like domain-containing protein [Desulfobulbaceae bacterium]|nr:rhodanese-like domain-containing protein [Desulfobulbaceae bacterium]